MKTKIWQRTVSAMLAVTLSILNISSTGLLSNIIPLSDMKASAEDSVYQQEYFKINGSIAFNEITGDINWKNIVRPTVFDQKIVIKQTYADENGKDQTIILPVQDLNKNEEFYIRFDDDGEGGGSFVVSNVPRYVTVDGKTYSVKSYKTEIQPTHEWYEFDNIDNPVYVPQDDSFTNFQGLTTVSLKLKTQKFTITPTVIPADADPSATFTFTNVFGKPAGIETTEDSFDYSASPAVNQHYEIDVPIGVSYSVVQEVKAGYKLNDKYTITIGNEDEKSDSKVEGVIKEGKNIEVTSSNFSQNLTKSFNITWTDNNNLSRPSRDESTYSEWFSIKFKNENNEWEEITEENCGSLGLDIPPVFKLSGTGAYYSGLSPSDPDGNLIEYKVELKSVPTGDHNLRYTCNEVVTEDGIQTFNFIEIIDFSADIKWNDDSNREKIRPDSLNNLVLHRVSENGTDVVISETVSITGTANQNIWSVSISDLPRYDENNYEYDYYISHEPIVVSIDPNPKNLSYKTYYENGTGAHGNDITKCHNHGTITEVLSSETDFSAQKQWLDPGADKNDRPDATVTLWRYVKKSDLTDVNGDNVIDLDDAYIKGVVSQVMINEGSDGKEKPLSYSLSKNEDSSVIFSINFTGENSEIFTLPGNDDEGQEYIYFVRESLSGDNADHYDIHYADADGKKHKYGALSGGTIKNVHSERVAVNVKKVWKNPESLEAIDGAKVQMKIFAPVIGTQNYEELTIYSEEENSHEVLTGDAQKESQTISGFTVDIPFSEITYYADIYNSKGEMLDMTKAVFQEIVTDKYGSVFQENVTDKNDNFIADVHDGIFEVAGTDYITSTTGGEYVMLGDGTKRFSYTRINTAKPTREYKLVKTWSGNIQYSDIEDVIFRLERISVNDLAKGSKDFKIVNGYEKCYVPYKSGSSTWESTIKKLDKYDENGNQYYYIARETGFVINGVEESLKDVQAARRWAVLYHRDYDQTEAVNYIPEDGGGYFTITKLWQDNSDTSGRDETVVYVYDKAELINSIKEHYDGSNPDEIVNIDSLIEPIKKSILKEADENNKKSYTTEFSYESGYSFKDFFVLEYSVGKESANPKPAQYTYSELMTALSKTDYSYSGTVENDNFQFDVKTVCDANGDLMIVNTRKGETSITVNKKWKDPDNADKRPYEIKFQLYQNELPYLNADSYVIINGAEIDANGVITVKSNSTEVGWTFTVSNLPMFSADGERLYYNVDEIPAESTPSLSYIQKKVKTEIESIDEKTQHFTFNFENTITGTTSHEAYKYWKDVSVPKTNRPDIYFILYRYLKKDVPENGDVTAAVSYQQYIDYKTQLWTTDYSDSDHENGYNLKVTVDELPRFDDEGNEYGYIFREKLNNNGISVLGKYYGTSDSRTAVDGTEYEVFTNTITDYMTINGSKVWKGFTGFQVTSDDYPLPDIYLYRTTRNDISNLQDKFQQWIEENNIEFEDNTWSALKEAFERWIEENDIEFVDKVSLDDKKQGYKFPSSNAREGFIEQIDDKYMLPKFNEDGVRYKYLVKESFSEEITDLLYTKTNANGTLTNEFRSDLNRCNITVHKQWDRGRLEEDEDKYPSVTYILKRDDVNYKKVTISAREFADSNGNASYTFSDLLIYSPSGKAYTYTIEEESINGYSITYYNKLNDESSIHEKQIYLEPYKVVGENWKNNVPNNIDAATKNSYSKPDYVKLSGEKIWNDRHDVVNKRPETIELTFIRSTSEEKGQGNSITNFNLGVLEEKAAEDSAVTGPYIVWNKTSEENGEDIWRYTIYNLERYAPNGLPYTYTLSETKVDGYKKSADAIGSAEKTGDVKMSELKNEFEGECYIQKIWYDGKNVYGLRPENIKIELQYSIDNGNSWNPFMTKNADGTMVKEEVVLTESNARPNTGKNTWEYRFTNLPLVDNQGRPCIYRCYETKINDLDARPANSDTSDSTVQEIPYEFELSEKVVNGEKIHIIENSLSSTSLVVKKIWADDNDDMYDSRPDNVRFKLQKEIIDEGGNPLGWRDVEIDGKPYIITISAKDDWTATLNDLPMAQILLDENSNAYRVYSVRFKAVELGPDGEVGSPPNYANRIDSEEDNRHEYTGINKSDITNRLILHENSTINVDKVWYMSVDHEPMTATFELLYRRTDKENEPWHCFGSENPTVDPDKTEEHTVTDKCLVQTISSASGSQNISWTNLPKKDRDGNDLEYKVVERPINNFRTIEEKSAESGTENYTFTNIEEQEFEVEKNWKNVSYAHKTKDGKFTAKFVLQQRIKGEEGWGDWGDVPDQNPITLISETTNDSKSDNWEKLPKFTNDGKPIEYRARETEINGAAVSNDTNGDYIVTYDDNAVKSTAENRMVYGFVNLSKMSAYLPVDNSSGGSNLAGVVFNIYDSENNLYVSNVKTDSAGNLECSNGKYGDEGKYLISGTYTLREITSNPDFSIWANGIQFTVGDGGTGEHGTAWIYTDELTLNVEYKPSVLSQTHDFTHSFDDGCQPVINVNSPAYNIESRGIIKFTKTGKDNPLDTHSGSENETPAYFAVYAELNGEKIQVAGLVPSAADKAEFVLTNTDKNGNAIEQNNAAGIPYLRQTGDFWTLLSGEYTIEEIVPPAGYKLDTTERTAIIKRIYAIGETNTASLYGDNAAAIEGKTAYRWENNPNTVTIYKKDQYGRNVKLGDNNYLVLSVSGATFPTGENEIHLYQNNENPATDIHGNSLEKRYISYNEGAWVITGLFDSGKTYTLSEPSAPEGYVQAVPIEFVVSSDGKMNVTNGAADANTNPTAANGGNYKSYYKADSNGNIMVMRDTSRYLVDVELKKQDMSDNDIANISFELYKYSETDTDGKPKNPISVLPAGVLLTTDSSGKTILSEQNNIINQITGSDLIYGLDYGKYYFHEVEHGASDQYILGNDIYFEIVAHEGNDHNQYSDYAEVVFAENAMVSQSGHTGVVKNEPVKDKKSLTLSKTDFDNGNPLNGAEFTLDYKSVTNGQAGSLNNRSYRCTIGADSKLYDMETEKAIDISNKGTYTLKEVKAPAQHMTRTDADGNPVTMIEFKVDSENKITVLSRHELVTVNTEDDTNLSLTIKNEKTVVSFSKLNDIYQSKKTNSQTDLRGEALNGAELEIYDGENKVAELTGGNNWTLTGELSENVIYRLHERKAPTGYMKADDIYFKFFGTTTAGNRVSVVKVWDSTETPALNGTHWTTRNLSSNTVTMVDEAIIAPVDAQKVIHNINGSYEALANAKFDVYVGSTKIGTAISNSDGYLVWEKVESFGLVFNSAGEKVTTDASVKGHTIILMQNDSGYTFRETYSPINAYNENYDDSTSYTVKITAENYRKYKQNSDSYIDIVKAQNAESHEIASIVRDTEATENDLVNPEFTSKVKLHKYDSDEEADRAEIPDTEFTLYKYKDKAKDDSTELYGNAVFGGSVVTSGTFITDSHGDIEIEIREKGDYILKETAASAGYVLDKNNCFEFTLSDSHYHGEQTLKHEGDDYGVPNDRFLGEVTLIKRDDKTQELLNGVVYTLTRTDANKTKSANPFNNAPDLVTGKKYTAVHNEEGWSLTEADGENGKIILVGLNWGNYTLVEKTELSGYKLDSSTVFEFTINGRVNELTFNPEPLNAKNKVTIHKQSTEEGHKALAGAVFQVLDSNNTSVEFYLSDQKGAEKVTEAVSDANGNVTVYGLPTNVTEETTFYLKEIKAPKGYILQDNMIKFTVDRYGNIRVSDAVIDKLTMKNYPIKIYIEKFSEGTADKLKGAEFDLTDTCGECENNHYLADDKNKTLPIVVENSGDMIPIEKVIGGHRYRLKETKAPDGYEATAVVDMLVNEDGTVTILESTNGGYISAGISCASSENNISEKTATVNIRDEKIRMTLTKYDYTTKTEKLSGVEFTLEPYNGSTFSDGSTDAKTFTTDSDGVIVFPEALMKHSYSYLLKELSNSDEYYLGNEARDGVILNVALDGNISITRQNISGGKNYVGNQINGVDSCPIKVTNTSNLEAYNMKNTSFELTKQVDGNMGDHNGVFQIKIQAFEPDTKFNPGSTLIGEETVTLSSGDVYSSLTEGTEFFNNLPVGARLEITENNDLDYDAVIILAGGREIKPDSNGVVTVTLNNDTNTLEIELINRKEVPIDVGVNLEIYSTLAVSAFLILSAWLYLKFRRKQVEI